MGKVKTHTAGGKTEDSSLAAGRVVRSTVQKDRQEPTLSSHSSAGRRACSLSSHLSSTSGEIHGRYNFFPTPCLPACTIQALPTHLSECREMLLWSGAESDGVMTDGDFMSASAASLEGSVIAVLTNDAFLVTSWCEGGECFYSCPRGAGRGCAGSSWAPSTASSAAVARHGGAGAGLCHPPALLWLKEGHQTQEFCILSFVLIARLFLPTPAWTKQAKCLFQVHPLRSSWTWAAKSYLRVLLSYN